MPKKLTLTPEEETRMYAYREEWMSHMLTRNGKIDQPAFEEGITWVYEKYLGKEKPSIMYADSWLAAVLQIEIVKMLKNKPNLGDNLGDNLRANLWANLGANLGDNLRITFAEYSWYVRIDDAAWTAFYDFGMQITGQAEHPLCQDLGKYIDLIKSGPFVTYLYDGLVVAVRPPNAIHRNERGQLHCTSGPAVSFNDGTVFYYINGRSVPKEIIENPDTITREQFLGERNAEIKGAIYEVLGQRRMFELLGAKEVDTRTIVHKNGDLETVTLYKTKERFAEINNNPFAWVKMVCPSTGTNYLVGVEPHHTNAVGAIASLSRFTPEEYAFTDRA